MSGFDVVIPVFKTEPEHLREAVDSVLNQTYQDFEIYISDGTPEDHEWHSSKTLADYDDERIHILQQEGKGISDARNQAFRAGYNSYVALLDSDDGWYNLKLEDYLHEFTENTDLKFLWGAADVNVEIVSPKGEKFSTTALGGYHEGWAKTSPTHRWFRVYWNPLMTSTHIYSRKALEIVGGWDSPYNGEDTELNIKIMKLWPNDVKQLEGIYGFYRSHPNQTTKDGATEQKDIGDDETIRLPYKDMIDALRLLDEIEEDSYWEWFDAVMQKERGRATGESLEWSIRTNERFFR